MRQTIGLLAITFLVWMALSATYKSLSDEGGNPGTATMGRKLLRIKADMTGATYTRARTNPVRIPTTIRFDLAAKNNPTGWAGHYVSRTFKNDETWMPRLGLGRTIPISGAQAAAAGNRAARTTQATQLDSIATRVQGTGSG